MTSASGAPCSSCRSVSRLCLCAPPFCATVSVSGGSGPARAEAGGTERHVQRGTERDRASSLALCPSAALPPLPLYLHPRSPPPRPLPPSVSVASRREPPPPYPSPPLCLAVSHRPPGAAPASRSRELMRRVAREPTTRARRSRPLKSQCGADCGGRGRWIMRDGLALSAVESHTTL